MALQEGSCGNALCCLKPWGRRAEVAKIKAKHRENLAYLRGDWTQQKLSLSVPRGFKELIDRCPLAPELAEEQLCETLRCQRANSRLETLASRV